MGFMKPICSLAFVLLDLYLIKFFFQKVIYYSTLKQGFKDFVMTCRKMSNSSQKNTAIPSFLSSR